jgi:hypothetical protein
MQSGGVSLSQTHDYTEFPANKFIKWFLTQHVHRLPETAAVVSSELECEAQVGATVPH